MEPLQGYGCPTPKKAKNFLKYVPYFGTQMLLQGHVPCTIVKKFVCFMLVQLLTIWTSLQIDNHTNTPSLKFYRPGDLPDAQRTVSKCWIYVKICEQNALTLNNAHYVYDRHTVDFGEVAQCPDGPQLHLRSLGHWHETQQWLKWPAHTASNQGPDLQNIVQFITRLS